MSQVIKVVKNRNYTVMGNWHLRDKNLSLKAKGLMSIVLSLPDDWEYSINGLTSLVKEGVTAVTTGLNELKKNGYLEIRKILPNETEDGRIGYEYIFYEDPASKEQDLEKQDIEILGLENRGLYKYTKELNKEDKELSTKVDKERSAPETMEIVGLTVVEEKGKLRVVNEKGEVIGGNPYTERAYQLWEEVMGCPLKRNQWNSRAGYNLLKAKDKGEDWCRKMLILLSECKKDTKADFRAKNIANLADLQKNWEYLLDWGRQKAKTGKNSVYV